MQLGFQRHLLGEVFGIFPPNLAYVSFEQIASDLFYTAAVLTTERTITLHGTIDPNHHDASHGYCGKILAFSRCGCAQRLDDGDWRIYRRVLRRFSARCCSDFPAGGVVEIRVNRLPVLAVLAFANAQQR